MVTPAVATAIKYIIDHHQLGLSADTRSLHAYVPLKDIANEEQLLETQQWCLQKFGRILTVQGKDEFAHDKAHVVLSPVLQDIMDFLAYQRCGRGTSFSSSEISDCELQRNVSYPASPMSLTSTIGSPSSMCSKGEDNIEFSSPPLRSLTE